MTAPEFYRWLDSLRNLMQFRDCTPLTDRQLSEQYDLELVIRYFTLSNSGDDLLRSFLDADTFFSDRTLALAEASSFDTVSRGSEFERLFTVLSHSGPDVFRKYDDKRKKPVGAFSVSAYEATTLGVKAHLSAWETVPPDGREERLRMCSSKLWHDVQFIENSGAGVRATQRIP